MIRYLYGCLALFMVAASFFWFSHRTSPQPIDSQRLLVGTNGEYPPYTFIQDSTLQGFEIDVAREAASRLGMAVEWKDMPFEALLPELQLGRIDFVAAGISSTPERAKRVLFTRPHLRGDPLLIIALNEKYDLAALKGHRVVVNDGYTADLYMSKVEGIELLRLPTPADALMALRAGRADAFVASRTTLETMRSVVGKEQLATTVLEDSSEDVSLGFPLSKAALRDRVQTALDGMEADGTLDRLRQQWGVVPK